MNKIAPEQERKFRSLVEYAGDFPDVHDCHAWRGMKSENGLGMFSMLSICYLAHRVAWALKHGGLLDRRKLRRLCKTFGCVNPDHYRPCVLRNNPPGTPDSEIAGFEKVLYLHTSLGMTAQEIAENHRLCRYHVNKALQLP